MNWHDFFGYEVQKVVRIHDPKLWIINFCLCLLVMVYIFVIQLWKQGGYAVGYAVEGAACVKLYEPTLNGCDMLNQSPCPLVLAPKTSLAYCSIYEGKAPAGQFQRPCKILSADAIQRRLPDSISVLTSVTEYDLVKACNQSLTNCNTTQNVNSKSTYYVSGIEDYTVSIFHTVSYAASPDSSAPTGYIGSSDNFPVGKLLVKNSDLCLNYANTVDTEGKPTNNAPCFLLATKNPHHILSRDEYPLSAILADIGVDLDDFNPGTGTSYRDSGMIITLQIVYQNFKQWSGISPVDFYYNPIFEPKIAYSYYDRVYTNYPSNQVLLSQNGILIATVATGEIFQFSGTQLLLTVTSSLTLFGVVTLIINTLLVKKTYEKSIKEDVEANARKQEDIEANVQKEGATMKDFGKMVMVQKQASMHLNEHPNEGVNVPSHSSLQKMDPLDKCDRKDQESEDALQSTNRTSFRSANFFF